MVPLLSSTADCRLVLPGMLVGERVVGLDSSSGTSTVGDASRREDPLAIGIVRLISAPPEAVETGQSCLGTLSTAPALEPWV